MLQHKYFGLVGINDFVSSPNLFFPQIMRNNLIQESHAKTGYFHYDFMIETAVFYDFSMFFCTILWRFYALREIITYSAKVQGIHFIKRATS